MPAKAIRTPEFETYRRTLRCPNGHRDTLRFIEGSGEIVTDLRLRDRLLLEVPTAKHEPQVASRIIRQLRIVNHRAFGAVPIEHLRVDSEIECAACATRWPVFFPPSFDLMEGETRRLHTLLGSDERIVDNRTWPTQAELSLEFERSWTRRLEVEWEHGTINGQVRSTSLGTSIYGFGLNAGIQRRVETTLKSRLSLTSEVRETSKHSIRVSIPPRMIAKVVGTWKQVWEETDNFLSLDDGTEIVVPYRVAVDVLLDTRMSPAS
jgi:hypothetical protein